MVMPGIVIQTYIIVDELIINNNVDLGLFGAPEGCFPN